MVALEEAGYLPTPGGPVYCFLHHPAPADASAPPPPAAVFVPPLMEERKCSYSAMATIARRLAVRGVAVARFDFMGTGESPGRHADLRLSRMEEDIAAVCSAARRWSAGRPIALLGLRLGAAIALRATPRIEGLAAVLAIAPVLSGAIQVRQWRQRSRIREAMTRKDGVARSGSPGRGDDETDMDGYEVSAEFLRDIESLDARKPDIPAAARVLAAQVSHSASPSPETAAFAASLGDRCRVACFRMEPFWDRVDGVDVSPLAEEIADFLTDRGRA
jgi:alpha-beta hydrolase superfamily lysophospholipase